MDALGSSCYSIHSELLQEMTPHDEKQRLQIEEIIASCKSLSYYESKTFKTLLPQIIATGIAASLHIVIGLSMVYSAILIPQLMEAQNSTSSDVIHITKSQSSWLASSLILIAPLAAISGGFLMDYIGRLNLLKLAAIPSILGWVLIATATDVPMLLAGRLLTGFAAIWGTCPAAVYVTEIGRPDVRGSLTAIMPFFISIGMVLGYLKGWFMNWRLIAWLCNVYTVIPIVLIMFIPESPAWLLLKGRSEQAGRSLKWLHKYQPQPKFKSETFAEMQLSILQKEQMLKMDEKERLTGNSFLQKVKMFMQPTGYKPLLILTGLFFLQQFSGIYIILFYGVTFFKEIGTDINPYLASVFLGVMRLIMTLANTWLMKRFNRRTLLLVSAAGMALFMGISGLYTMWIQEGVTTKHWVPVAMLMMYFISAAIGLMPIPFTIIAELFPLAIRGVAHSIVTSLLNIIMFSALHSYYSLHQLFGGSSGLQYFFAITSLGAFVYGYVFMPETHRKKLSDIEEYFWHHTTYLSVPPEEINNKHTDKKLLLTLNNNNYINVNQEKV